MQASMFEVLMPHIVQGHLQMIWKPLQPMAGRPASRCHSTQLQAGPVLSRVSASAHNAMLAGVPI